MPTYLGGLGFGFKWDMGWMHDTLLYFSKEPVHRAYHHNDLTFAMLYAYTENFIMPLSHDEVVHGKGSLLGKMPGDEWQRFANLRSPLRLPCTRGPGKKLLFMGAEFAQGREWQQRQQPRLAPDPVSRRTRGSSCSWRTSAGSTGRARRSGPGTPSRRDTSGSTAPTAHRACSATSGEDRADSW